MHRVKSVCTELAVAVAVLFVVTSVASAQDVFKINYFSNANRAYVPDATVRIDNPGLTYGNLCAMIYVFDQDQQMSECCGCVETHNGLRTLSVNCDLTSNPLHRHPGQRSGHLLLRLGRLVRLQSRLPEISRWGSSMRQEKSAGLTTGAFPAYFVSPKATNTLRPIMARPEATR